MHNPEVAVDNVVHSSSSLHQSCHLSAGLQHNAELFRRQEARVGLQMDELLNLGKYLLEELLEKTSVVCHVDHDRRDRSAACRNISMCK
jgi:hypothetical protein